jgi:hypothetical protein
MLFDVRAEDARGSDWSLLLVSFEDGEGLAGVAGLEGVGGDDGFATAVEGLEASRFACARERRAKAASTVVAVVSPSRVRLRMQALLESAPIVSDGVGRDAIRHLRGLVWNEKTAERN